MQVPLTVDDIRHIIKLDEADYIIELEKLVVARLDLEQKLEAQRIAKEERELEAKEKALSEMDIISTKVVKLLKELKKVYK